MDLEIEFRPGPVGESKIWIGRGYLEAMSVEYVSPTPRREVADATGTTYVFEVSPGAELVTATFRFEPRRIGPLRGLVRIDDGRELSFEQFIHP